MTHVKIWVEDSNLGDIVIDNGPMSDLEVRMCDDPKDILRKELDTTVARVKEAFQISPIAADPAALGRAASYVLTDPLALAMSEHQVGQAIIDRLANS